MDSVEKVAIEYEIKTEFALKNPDDFTFEDLKYIHDNRHEFNDYFVGNPGGHWKLTKDDFDVLCSHIASGKDSVCNEIMYKYKEVLPSKVVNSSYRYCIPQRRDREEFYVFKYSELEILFNVLLFGMESNAIESFKKRVHGRHLISLKNEKYEHEIEVYTVPVEDLPLMSKRFKQHFESFVKENPKYSTKLNQKYGILK